MSKEERPSILVSVPNQGWIHKHAAFSLLKLQQDNRVNATFILPTHKPYINSLHKIINDAIDGQFDYWISFDADNPPRHNIFDLVFLDKDIIGCPTPVWHNAVKGDFPLYWNALNKVDGGWKPHTQKKGLQSVDAVGSGCIVVKTKVLKAMANAPKRERWFMRDWNERGEVEHGGDFMFCQRAKNAGFNIYAHFGYPCYHFNEIELGEVNQAYTGVNS